MSKLKLSKLVVFSDCGLFEAIDVSDVFKRVFVIKTAFSVDKLKFLVEVTYFSGCIISLNGSFVEFLFKFAKSSTS